MIYLDNNATTAIDPQVLDAMLPYLREQYGNPSSAYSFGKKVARAIDQAREQVASLVHCDPAEIVFTSCGTESDNSAIQSALLIDRDRKHIVTSKVEHSAILKQEDKRRGGTHNTVSIVGLGKAAELAAQHLAEENTRVKNMRDRFEQEVMARISGIQINGDPDRRLPNTANLAIEGADSEALLMLLDQKGVCCSAGSACTAGALEPSHVLRAMGFSTERARASLRFSFGRFNTEQEVSSAIGSLETAVVKVRCANCC